MQSQPKRRTLSRTRIVTAAFELLDKKGLSDLSLRGLAEILDVQAPALYKHFKNKDALLLAMTQQLFNDWAASMAQVAQTSWKTYLSESAAALRRVLCAHRDGPRLFVMYHPYVQSPLGPTILTMLREQGFSPTDAVYSASTLISYVTGFSLEENFETTTEPIAEVRLNEGIPAEFIFKQADYDTEFAYGVARIIEGIDRRS